MFDMAEYIMTAQSTDETDGGWEALLKGVNNVVGVLANWFQVVTTLVPLIENALSNSPDMGTQLTQIENGVQAIERAQFAEDAKQDRRDFNSLLTAASNDLNNLLLWGKNNPMIEPSRYFSDAQNAAYAFQNPSTYWFRPYFEDIAFFAPGFPNNGNPPVSSVGGGLFVYDPILAFPAFAAAISVFTQMVTIFHEDTNDALLVQPFFTDLADILEREYDRATAGMVTVPIPTIDQLNYLAVAGSAFDGTSILSIWGTRVELTDAPWVGEVGVADVYAAFSRGFGPPGYDSAMRGVSMEWVYPTINLGNIIDVYPTNGTLLQYFQPAGSYSPQQQVNAYRWFRLRMRLGNLARFKALYLAKSYDQVWLLVQQLRRLSGGQPGSPNALYGQLPAKPVETSDRNAHWSLVELDAIIGESGGWLSPKYWCAAYASQEDPSCAVPGASSLQVTAEGVIIKLLAALDNATQHPVDAQRLWAAPRPVSLRKTILTVAV
jgi:hypothetical protein